MAKQNRLRCPTCGACYEVDAMAAETEAVACHVCNSTTKLVEEDPDGIVSGAFPPLPRLLALGGTLLLCLVAIKLPFFAVLAFGVTVYLSIEILQAHKKQRADRIAGWDRLRTAYVSMSDGKAALHT